jgi:hypothetical protein
MSNTNIQPLYETAVGLAWPTGRVPPVEPATTILYGGCRGYRSFKGRFDVTAVRYDGNDIVFKGVK